MAKAPPGYIPSFPQLDLLDYLKKIGQVGTCCCNGNVVKALLRRDLIKYDKSNYLVLTSKGKQVVE